MGGSDKATSRPLWIARFAYDFANNVKKINNENIKLTVKDFNEIPVEQGVEQEDVLVIVLANKQRNWTMFVSKINNPYTYCSLMSGTYWSQKEGSSTGILPNGSVVAIGYSDNGDWSRVILNVLTGLPKQITTGTGWEQLINLNVQSNSL